MNVVGSGGGGVVVVAVAGDAGDAGAAGDAGDADDADDAVAAASTVDANAKKTRAGMRARSSAHPCAHASFVFGWTLSMRRYFQLAGFDFI